jgi:Ser/Thr protein kinase RdoA (MazF antagonist)
MSKLEQDKQIKVNNENITTILRFYDITKFTYREIKQGIENTSLYIEEDNKKYVLRIYRADSKTDKEICFELEFQDYLRKHKIPIPIIYKNIDGNELSIIELGSTKWQVILMEFCKGDIGISNITYSNQLIHELATIQSKMHKLGVVFSKKYPCENKWKNLKDSYVIKIDVNKYSDRIKSFLQRSNSFSYILPTEITYGYNHLDIDFDGNVIVNNDTISGIIDFDDLKYSPNIVCLGYTLWGILFDYGIDEMNTYLKKYQELHPLNQFEMEALPQCILFRNYTIGVLNRLFEGSDEKIEKIIKLESEIPRLFNSYNL